MNTISEKISMPTQNNIKKSDKNNHLSEEKYFAENKSMSSNYSFAVRSNALAGISFGASVGKIQNSLEVELGLLLKNYRKKGVIRSYKNDFAKKFVEEIINSPIDQTTILYVTGIELVKTPSTLIKTVESPLITKLNESFKKSNLIVELDGDIFTKKSFNPSENDLSNAKNAIKSIVNGEEVDNIKPTKRGGVLIYRAISALDPVFDEIPNKIRCFISTPKNIREEMMQESINLPDKGIIRTYINRINEVNDFIIDGDSKEQEEFFERFLKFTLKAKEKAQEKFSYKKN